VIRITSPNASFEVAYFRNREAMAARSRGRKATVERQKMILSREAAPAHSAKVDCCRRFAAHDLIVFHFLRAYARSYVLPPLRG
jgi:hypothetical protein